MGLPVTLHDINLIKFLKVNIHSIEFLSESTIDMFINNERVINIKNDTEDTNILSEIFNPSKEGSLDVLKFWEHLLFDAIRYLKWNDSTEFPLDKLERLNLNKNSAYERISVDSLGVNNLKEYFSDFIKFEKLLYGAEQFYRDHVYHIIRVWLTGQYILHKCINDGFRIFIAEENLNLNNEKRKIYRPASKNKPSLKTKNTLYKGEEDAIWCIIALTHDLGYPLSKFEKINDQIKKMTGYFAKSGVEELSFAFPLQNQFINDAILRYMSSKIVSGEGKYNVTKKYKTNIQAKYYLKYSRSFERFDHGLISCLVLAKNLIYFLETNYDWDDDHFLNKAEARQFVIRREILRSIASHTCTEIYHLKPNTFAFLLLISDEMQFWGRPTFETLATGVQKQYTVELKRFDGKEVSFEIRSNHVDNNAKKETLNSFFMTKVKMFKQIFRIAVDSAERDFDMNMCIYDELGDKYQFIYKKDQPPRIELNGIVYNNHNDIQDLGMILNEGKKYAERHKMYGKYKEGRENIRNTSASRRKSGI